jgi:hypothetical protein
MNYTYLIVIVVLVILVSLVLKLIKSAAKTVFYSLVIFLVALAFLGFYVAKDLNEFGQKMSSDEIIFVLTQNESVISGFVYQNQTMKRSLNSNEIIDTEFRILHKVYDELYDEDQLFFQIDITALESIDTKDIEYINSLSNSTANTTLETKSSYFKHIITKNINERPTYLVSMFKKSLIDVYPKSFAFRIIDLIP